MNYIEKLVEGDKKLYSTGYFSGEYNQDLYIKRSLDDSSNKPKYYISILSKMNGDLVIQGYLYFYLDHQSKTSHFIGVKVNDLYRNLNIGSFLIASWIELCFDNGYDFLKVNDKQRKPFLIYLLKTYGFEVLDKLLYETSNDVISIYRSLDFNDIDKYLLFKDLKNEKRFIETNVFKTDNYKIIHTNEGMIFLDDIIMPIQNYKKSKLDFELRDEELAKIKSKNVIKRHTR